MVLPFLQPEQAALLRSELAFQNHVAASSAWRALPRGAVHADLFRDNVMFEDGKLTGFFDFYFAGVDAWLFDLAVCLNDWAIDLPTGRHVPERARAFVDAYASVRPLSAAERQLLPAMLRAGALRFWLSRLWDFHLPREASLLKPHDPPISNACCASASRTPLPPASSEAPAGRTRRLRAACVKFVTPARRLDG